MKELTFEEAANWAMGEYFTESGNYSDLVHIVECGQSFDDIGLEPIEEYEHDTPETMLRKVDSLAHATQDLSTHGVNNIKEAMSQDDLIDFVAKQISLWVTEEMEANADALQNLQVSFENRACEHIDGFIEDLQNKAYKVREHAAC